ncbi:MAG TPA: transcription antitermination factor NusB [Acidimicrobiales bacterium]|nr:transcription antitermination factor NusB [Acidimicrobiales bacterium]
MTEPDARRLAADALIAIEDGAYANLLLPSMLADSGLTMRDRGFATELVYGTTRMRRACDHLVDRFVMRQLDPPTRAALRLGAYQLQMLGTPAHAAVSATVEVAPRRSRGLVNAVLRRVSTAPVEWPSEAVRLSYPDWVLDRLTDDLGHDDAVAALEQMNEAPEVSERPDGYTQDLASQWVAASVGAAAGERVADICAAPGGKATFMAGTGAVVLASDINPARVAMVAGNAEATGAETVHVAVADGRRAPWRPGAFDHVLVDAPCSGLGVLRRRPDARWRVGPEEVIRLAALQRELLDAAVALVAPGGTLTYSVCTLTASETVEVDAWLGERHPVLEALPAPGEPWRPHGRGALLLPQAAGTDGMGLLRLRRPEAG